MCFQGNVRAEPVTKSMVCVIQRPLGPRAYAPFAPFVGPRISTAISGESVVRLPAADAGS